MEDRKRSDSKERMRREINRQKQEREMKGTEEFDNMEVDEDMDMSDQRFMMKKELPCFFYDQGFPDVLDNSVFDKWFLVYVNFDLQLM